MKCVKLIAVWAALMVLASTGVSSAQEIRLAIVTVFEDINDTNSIQSQIDEIAASNYNAVAVHARYRGDATYFPNKYDNTYPNNEPRTSAAGNIDVIEEFTTRGHAAGLKVFAYVNIFCVTDGQNSDFRSNHVLNTNPDWVTYRNANGSIARQSTADDPDGKWLDPGIPAVRNYSADICGDIMMNYDVDGIVIDRIRYPWARWPRESMDFGYHPTAIANFNAQFGRSGTPQPSDSAWIQFRRDQVKETVRVINDRITEIDPAHMLLSFPIGTRRESFDFCYQEWTAWLEDEVIDVCFPQIYDKSNSSFTTRLDDNLATYDNNTRWVAVALDGYTSNVDLSGQADIARNKGLKGVALYRHATLAGAGQLGELAQTFPSPVAFPSMPWKPSSGEVIIDNSDSGFTTTGSWGVSSSPGFYGTNSLYAFTGGASATARWTPSLGESGQYEVYARWVAGSNRSSSAPFTIQHLDGSTSVNANQSTNGSQWNLLGTYNFNAGSGGYIQLGDQTSQGVVVSADAVRLVRIGDLPSSQPDVIVDNTDSGFSASSNWFSSSYVSGYLGSSYSARATASTGDSAAWTATLPTSGSYDVYARWTTGSNRATSAPYFVYHAGGSTRVNQNQTQNNGQWVLLGTYNFNAGTAVRVRLSCWTSSGDYVIADGVRFVKN